MTLQHLQEEYVKYSKNTNSETG